MDCVFKMFLQTVSDAIPVCSTTKNFNFMAPFYGWGSTASRQEPLRGSSLFFTTKLPETPGTHFFDLGRMKG